MVIDHAQRDEWYIQKVLSSLLDALNELKNNELKITREISGVIPSPVCIVSSEIPEEKIVRFVVTQQYGVFK